MSSEATDTWRNMSIKSYAPVLHRKNSLKFGAFSIELLPMVVLNWIVLKFFFILFSVNSVNRKKKLKILPKRRRDIFILIKLVV